MSNKINFALDLTIFSTFMVAASPALTGLAVHEWLSVAFAAAIVTHILFHWNWVVKVTVEFFKKLFHQSRLNYIVDALFFVAMTSLVLSGLLISRNVLPTLGIQLTAAERTWRSIHILSADSAMILLGIHFGLHWKWVVNSLNRYVVSPIHSLFHRPAPQTLAVQSVRIDKEN